MGLLDTISGAAGTGIAKIFTDVMDTIKLAPEKKAELQEAVMAHEAELAKLQDDYETKLADVAGQNIRSETGSEDKYTSRARPTFLYIIEFILGWNYIIVPLLKGSPVELPGELLFLFGSAMLGYTGARTWEKLATSGAVPQLPGLPKK